MLQAGWLSGRQNARSVSHRLSERFQLIAIALGKIITLAFDFHHQMVHSFG